MCRKFCAITSSFAPGNVETAAFHHRPVQPDLVCPPSLASLTQRFLKYFFFPGFRFSKFYPLGHVLVSIKFCPPSLASLTQKVSDLSTFSKIMFFLDLSFQNFIFLAMSQFLSHFAHLHWPLSKFEISNLFSDISYFSRLFQFLSILISISLPSFKILDHFPIVPELFQMFKYVNYYRLGSSYPYEEKKYYLRVTNGQTESNNPLRCLDILHTYRGCNTYSDAGREFRMLFPYDNDGLLQIFAWTVQASQRCTYFPGIKPSQQQSNPSLFLPDLAQSATVILISCKILGFTQSREK